MTAGSYCQARYYIYVGDKGIDGTTSTGARAGGFNGGGTSTYLYSGSGGGASDIRTSASGTSYTNRLVVAGGGGGAGYNCASSPYNQQTGGPGGSSVGGAGFVCNANTNTSQCGQGGTQTAGGAGATSFGGSGSLGAGQNASTGIYSGGGGGGYYGGGAGYYGGGGGGSSFPASTGGSVSSITHTQGCNDSVGYVILYPTTPAPAVVASPTSLSFGAVVASATSTALSFAMTGTLMTSSPVTITAPTNFEVSPTGTGSWGSSYTQTITTPSFSAITVYVRFVAPATSGTYTGNVVISGGGLGSCVTNVAVSGVSANLCSGTPAPYYSYSYIW